jgi:uncharacterized membrane protein
MEGPLNDILNLLFRWIHVIAGILWIGHLWFFNFANSQVALTYDNDSKKKVVPELMPRALFWFRFGSIFTWVTGFLLLGMVYYGGGAMVYPEQSLGLAVALGIGSMIIAVPIYDLLWKALAKNEVAGTIVSFVLLAGAVLGLHAFMSGRALFIHIGAIFGTIMIQNVWARIWPNQRKLIEAAKAGTAPPEGAAAMAALRSKHNTYLSIPLLFFMISNHYPTVYGDNLNWLYALLFVALGWLITKWLYSISAKPATAKF